MAPEMWLALIQILLGLAIGLVGAFLARTRAGELPAVRTVVGRTIALLGLAAILIGLVGISGAAGLVRPAPAAVAQTVIALAAVAVAVRFCLRYGRTPTS